MPGRQVRGAPDLPGGALQPLNNYLKIESRAQPKNTGLLSPGLTCGLSVQEGIGAAVVTHSCDPSTQEAEARRSP